MRKLLLASGILIGAFYLLRKCEQRLSEESGEEDDTVENDSDGTLPTVSNNSGDDYVIVGDIKDTNKYRGHSDYAYGSGAISDADVLKGRKAYNKEAERKEYQKTHSNTSKSEVHIDGFDKYTYKLLENVSKDTDTDLYMLMAVLIENYKLGSDNLKPYPTGYQKEAEKGVFDEIKYNKELYLDKELKNYYGSVGELLLWFANYVSNDTERSIAGSLDEFLRNGGFYDGLIKEDGRYLFDDNKILEASVLLLSSDSQNVNRLIFGEPILNEINQLPLEDKTWTDQIRSYTDRILGHFDE